MHPAKAFVATLLVATTLFANDAAAQSAGYNPARRAPLQGSGQQCRQIPNSDSWSRTELYFGLSRAQGPAISDIEFQDFVDTEVTPRFPDGLTVLDGYGQWRNGSGQIVQEGSKLLILLHPGGRPASRSVDAIRDAYKARFQQESVLRVDEQNCVSF